LLLSCCIERWIFLTLSLKPLLKVPGGLQLD